MNKINLEPGRKYRGSGWVNQYGEMFFRPEQKGGKPGNLHLVLEHETFSLYESARMWKVTVKFEKAGFSIREWEGKQFQNARLYNVSVLI